jgi:hypothetical protein
LPVSFAAQSELYASFRFRLDSNTRDHPVLFQLVDTAGTNQLRFELGVTNNGLKVFRAGDSDNIGQNPPLAVGAAYRIDVHVVAATALSSSVQVKVTVPAGVTIPIVDQPFPGAIRPFTQVTVGNLVGGDALSATFDNIMVSKTPLP